MYYYRVAIDDALEIAGNKDRRVNLEGDAVRQFGDAAFACADVPGVLFDNDGCFRIDSLPVNGLLHIRVKAPRQSHCEKGNPKRDGR